MNTDISVVISTYNGARFIREALESVFAQALLPKEIIVVDDASTDDTPAIVSSMIATSSVQFRLIRLKKNSGGPAHPLNIGINVAKGEFIAILDQDDVFLPHKLQDQVTLLANDPKMAFIFSCCGYPDRPNQMIQSSRLIQELALLSESNEGIYQIAGSNLLRLFLKQGNVVLGYPGFLFRRKDWEQKRGLDEKLRIGSDYDFLCWLCSRGIVGFSPKILYLRRQHQINMCNQRSNMFLDIYRIKTRYLLKERNLLFNKDLAASIQKELLCFSYWCRQAHCFDHARESLRLYSRVWGCNHEVLLEAGKLLSHKILSCLTHRQPVYTSLTEIIH